jgi:hypothetical protein
MPSGNVFAYGAPSSPEGWPPVIEPVFVPLPYPAPEPVRHGNVDLSTLLGPSRAEFQSAVESIRAAIRDLAESVAHRDVKPEKVKVTSGYRVVYTDRDGVRWYARNAECGASSVHRADAHNFTNDRAAWDASRTWVKRFWANGLRKPRISIVRVVRRAAP